MYSENTTLVYIVDKDTKSSAAANLVKESADETWNTFMCIWVCVYLGFPDVIATDQGPHLRSQRWKRLLFLAKTKLKHSGVQSHNDLGVGERYHGHFRAIYRKVQYEYQHVDKHQSLAISFKTMNDTASLHSLVVSFLLFTCMKRIVITPLDLPSKIERMKSIALARRNMSQIMAKERMAKALRMNAPASVNEEVSIESEVLLYRKKPENKWVGPYLVLDMKDKSMCIDDKVSTVQESIEKGKFTKTTFRRC